MRVVTRARCDARTEKHTPYTPRGRSLHATLSPPLGALWGMGDRQSFQSNVVLRIIIVNVRKVRRQASHARAHSGFHGAPRFCDWMMCKKSEMSRILSNLNLAESSGNDFLPV
jgi:hypothetical protein